MVLADTMAVFLVILGLLLAFPSFWLMCLGLWPDTVHRSAKAVAGGFWKSLFIGIPITAIAIFAVIAIGQLHNNLTNIVALMILCLYFLFANTGMAGMATVIGQRLGAPLEKPGKATLRGGAILALAYLLPFAGWFLVLPFSIIIGSGTAARAVWPRGKKQKQKQEDTETGSREDAIP